MGGVRQKKNVKELIDFVSWFEIPAIDFNQAVVFYNQIFDIELTQQTNEANKMAFFPVKSGIGGAIICGPGSIPSDKGPLIYLNGGKDLNTVLSRVKSSGGQIVMSKTLIGQEEGYFAIFIDCQGNKLALHSKD
jgi:predicted enzyme related to lactoylglutathione lyase